MKTKSSFFYHALAVFCILVWGTTFVSTKTLLNHSLTPVSIFFYRFAMSYIVLLPLAPKTLCCKNLKDELTCFILGVSGGSLYFLTENTALRIAFVNNVALLVCTAPLFTAIFSRLWLRSEKMGKYFAAGSLLAFLGVALVVFNGQFLLASNPLGDALSIAAALLWALYTILLKTLDSRYEVLFITRKVFFYGLLTITPCFFVSPLQTDLAVLTSPVVAGNLLYLGIVASLLCFALWNLALKHLGSVTPTNYIYFNPVIALVAAAVFLGERITPVAATGAALILAGIFIAEKHRR